MNRKAQKESSSEQKQKSKRKAAARGLDKSAARSWIRERTKAAAEKGKQQQKKQKQQQRKNTGGSWRAKANKSNTKNDMKACERQVSGVRSGEPIAPPVF